MKKTFITLLFVAVLVYPLMGQTAGNYAFKFDNGTVVKTERDWGHIWIQQKQEAFAANEEHQSVVIRITTFGELGNNTTFKLSSGGKDVKLKDAAPGMYDLKITSKLIGKPGTITFDASGIEVKAKMKTTVTVTIYKYQINIEDAAAANKGLAAYEAKIAWYKGNFDQTGKVASIAFYSKGAHDQKLTPDAVTTDFSGKIKPGTYDILISVDISGKVQKVWIENIALKADMNYKLITNMNAGTVSYAGGNRDMKILMLYPAGTADRTPKADKSTAMLVYEPSYSTYPCPPGSYDVLLTNGTGKSEWKKNVVVRSAARTDIR